MGEVGSMTARKGGRKGNVQEVDDGSGANARRRLVPCLGAVHTLRTQKFSVSLALRTDNLPVDAGLPETRAKVTAWRWSFVEYTCVPSDRTPQGTCPTQR